MKKLLYLLLLVAVWSACSNDFDVAAPWKEVPVAYAILAPRDTAHYVRIEKAFLDPNKSAFEIAQIADSLYYPESAISVWLLRTSNNTRVQLQRVDGNLEGHVRDEGIFADQPNWLYKVKGYPLVPGEKYRLVIQRSDGRADITAETTIPKDFTIISPSPADLVRKIGFQSSVPTPVEWSSDENGAYFNITFILPYREESPTGMVLLRDTLLWQAGNNVERASIQVGPGIYRNLLQASGADLFRFLASSLQPTSTTFRYFERGSIVVVGGGKEIREFNVTASANSGITGAEVYPTYTNLSEGFGVFTAKNEFKMNNVQITEGTIDSMKLNPITQGLNFRF